MAVDLVKADKSDVSFIVERILLDTEKGHFEPLLLEVEQRKLLRKNIQSMIQKERWHKSDQRAQVIIGESDSKRIGFAIMSEMEAGLGGTELFGFSISPQVRGKGLGKGFLDLVLQRWAHQTDIYARCFPKSEVMKGLLAQRGFAEVESSSGGVVLLKRCRDAVGR